MNPSREALNAANEICNPGGVGVHDVRYERRVAAIVQQAIDHQAKMNDMKTTDLLEALKAIFNECTVWTYDQPKPDFTEGFDFRKLEAWEKARKAIAKATNP